MIYYFTVKLKVDENKYSTNRDQMEVTLSDIIEEATDGEVEDIDVWQMEQEDER